MMATITMDSDMAATAMESLEGIEGSDCDTQELAGEDLGSKVRMGLSYRRPCSG